jgi:hypothetical protein
VVQLTLPDLRMMGRKLSVVAGITFSAGTEISCHEPGVMATIRVSVGVPVCEPPAYPPDEREMFTGLEFGAVTRT